MYDEDTLYVYSYSDFDEDYVFMETKYELSDVKRLEQENKQLKKQLGQKEELINKLKNQPTVYLTKYMDEFGFVETKTLNELIEELEKSDK